MLIDNSCSFNPIHTFECGQCFRWNSDKSGTYIGIAEGRICRVADNEIDCPAQDEDFWREYFALDTDYGDIRRRLIGLDPQLEECIDFGGGIHILKQNLWETIISFIISANNNIPRIKKIVETLCRLYGDETEYKGSILFSFPSAEVIAALDKEALAPLRAGYRDEYILDAARKVSSGEVNIELLPSLSDADAKKELMKIKGVGGKVADCILLFSLGRYSVFPTDVWIKRILSQIYNIDDKAIPAFVARKYGELAGYAQQYLYYYYRSKAE